MGVSLPPVTAASLRSFVSYPAIEAFSSAIVGDGVTDDSAAIMTAHNAAFAAGVRDVACSKQYYAPSAYNLGNVAFWGEGALIGTYRKKIIPPSARAIGFTSSDINPAIHLNIAAKAVAPTVIFMGDSTTTESANHVSEAEVLVSQLKNAIFRANPGVAIKFLNYAIGGTALSDFLNTGTTLDGEGITLPNWYTNVPEHWYSYAQNQAPDLLIFNWGTNNPAVTNCSEWQTIFANIATWTKIPNIILITNLPDSTQAYSGSAQQTNNFPRDVAAGAMRSVAKFYSGYSPTFVNAIGAVGLIDLHRFACMARDGFDPRTQVMTQNITSPTTLSLPATLPETQQDFDLAFTIDNTGGQAFGSDNTRQIAVTLSSVSGEYFKFYNSDAGTFNVAAAPGGGSLSWLGNTTTASPVISGINTFELSKRNNFIWFTINGVAVNGAALIEYPGLMSGGEFQPQIAYVSGSGVTSVSVTGYVTSAPALCQPCLTDADMFGPNALGAYPNGGNGVNHPASAAYENIHAQVIDQIDFCFAEAGRPIQSIIAVGAVNPTASLIELTGPATGTYAITLAAPRLIDKGKTLAIEMVATTSTNAVTMALINVTGGTAVTTCTWNGAGQRLILIALGSTWEVVKQDGVTLI